MSKQIKYSNAYVHSWCLLDRWCKQHKDGKKNVKLYLQDQETKVVHACENKMKVRLLAVLGIQVLDCRQSNEMKKSWKKCVEKVVVNLGAHEEAASGQTVTN